MTVSSHFFLSLHLTLHWQEAAAEAPLLDRAAAPVSSRMVLTGEIIFLKTHTLKKNPLSQAMLVISTAVSQKKLSQGVISMATAMVTEEKGREQGRLPSCPLSSHGVHQGSFHTPSRMMTCLLLLVRWSLSDVAGPLGWRLGRLRFSLPVLSI